MEKKLLEAVDMVCLNCVEDTLTDNSCCEKCPVRRLVDVNTNSKEKEWDFEAKVTGYFHTVIKAETLEEAKQKGLETYYETNFSNMEDIETEHLCVSDENGNDYYY